MNLFGKIALFLCAMVVTILLLRHGQTAMHAARPADMPPGSSFLPSGYDVNSNEQEGNWISCRVDVPERANWCRVADAKGVVVFEGNFLPIQGRRAIPEEQLEIAIVNPTRLWIHGPAEGIPVPVIPLRNGVLLVPAGDQELLLDRWGRDPEELNRLRAQ